MTKPGIDRNEMLKDLLTGQLEMLRVRLVQDIADIDKYIVDIERRFKGSKKNA